MSVAYVDIIMQLLWLVRLHEDAEFGPAYALI